MSITSYHIFLNDPLLARAIEQGKGPFTDVQLLDSTLKELANELFKSDLDLEYSVDTDGRIEIAGVNEKVARLLVLQIADHIEENYLWLRIEDSAF